MLFAGKKQCCYGLYLQEIKYVVKSGQGFNNLRVFEYRCC